MKGNVEKCVKIGNIPLLRGKYSFILRGGIVKKKQKLLILNVRLLGSMTSKDSGLSVKNRHRGRRSFGCGWLN